MSGISGVPSHVSQLIQSAAAKNETQNQIAYAVAAKSKDASTQMSEAMLQLVEQASNVQQQLASGRLDVRA